MAEISPMMQQYLDIKARHKDTILFFRLGDFYEMFFDDAKLVSEELDLTLTGKDYGKGERAPMCGVPYHSCEAYIARLVAKGYKVAMCDQVESAAEAKGLVKREVVRVITPGTVMEESMLDESKNNYICSLYLSEATAGVSFCDISTGQIKLTELVSKSESIQKQLKNELGKFAPREVLISGKIEMLESLKNFIKEKLSCSIELIDEKNAEFEFAKNVVLDHFKKDNLNNLNLEDKLFAVKSLGVLFAYLKETQKNGLERINSVDVYSETEYIGLDLNTIRNLELIETMRSKNKRGSLLWVLDKTKTAMGKRLLRSWVERPLMDINEIKLRQDAVGELVKNIMLRDDLTSNLSGVHDIERLMTKITYGSANGRDLKSLSSTLSKLPELKFNLQKAQAPMLKDICENLDLLKEVFMLIEDAIVDEPPFTVREGGIIKNDYSSEIDELRTHMNGGTSAVAEIEQKERQKTGISKLKIGYNRIFGYYIEVTNSFKNMVPENYIRKQTLSNCERYITQELKDLESKILYAKDKISEIEYQIFEQVRLKVANSLVRIAKTANTIAVLDVIRSLAEVAYNQSYTKPEIDDQKSIIIKEGWHPVVKELLSGVLFVPNNALLDNDSNMVSIITGPNMSGKSTYMRQTALIVLLAQIGSFVPAASAKIGIVDSIFTRIGASDDLAAGQSTFMVEMTEVAEIVKNATSNSLLILDEIGRGTSTFDGMSIARAILEYVSDTKKLGAKTLFATHYHELTSMVDEYPNIKNYNIAVKKNGEDIVFLRRIVPGAADDSYGIEVAKLAGVPKTITQRAKEVLKQIESEKNAGTNLQPVDTCVQLMVKKENTASIKILNRLKRLDVSVLTPIESMNTLFELINLANAEANNEED